MKKLILQPDYMKNFKCIGSECPESCCCGWGIMIDKKTYKAYKKIRDLELKKCIEKNIKRNRKTTNDDGYAEIVLDENNRCSFLDSEELCEIHKKCGHDALSKTCRQYPRIINIVDDAVEISASISCPVVCELMLKNKNKMTFDAFEKEIDLSKKSVLLEFSTNSSNKLNKNFWKLREVSIDIMQDRRFELWQRVAILGFVLNKVQDAINNEEKINISDTIEENYNKYCDEYIKDMLNEIELQENLLKEFIDIACSINTGDKTDVEYYNKLYSRFLKGICFDKMDDKIIIEKYKKGSKEIYKPFMKNSEYILENYLVNNIFYETFPLKRGKNILEDYCLLVIKFALAKLFLIGIGNYHDELNFDNVKETLYLFSRNIEHSQQLLSNILEMIKEKDCLNLAFLISLVKE